MARVTKGIAGLVALVALIAGVPWLLVRTVGNPWPGRTAIDLRDEREILLGLLVVAAWVVWARFVVAIVQETVAQVRSLRAQRRRAEAPLVAPVVAPDAPSGGFGFVAHRLVAAVLALVPLAPASMGAPGPLPARSAPVAAVASLPRPDLPARAAASVRASALPEVQVRDNDSLFRIAERHLGDRARWREILDLNAGRLQADGGRLTTPSSLRSGWTMQLPADAVVGIPADPAVAPLDPSSATHLVQPGDSYWEIADEHLSASLGRPATEAEVLDATHTLLDLNAPLFGYDDPAMIHPGDEVVLPPELAPPPPPVDPSTSSQSEPTPAPGQPASATPSEPVPADRSASDLPAPPAPATSPSTTPSGASAADTSAAAPAPATSPVEPGSGASSEPSPADPPASVAPAPGDSTPAPPPTAPVAEGGGLGPSRGEALPAPVPPTTPVIDPELLGTAGADRADHAVPLGLGAAVLVAGGALALVDSRRRAALRRASAHARLDGILPSGTTEMTLRALGATDRLVRLDVVLRSLAAAVRDQAARSDLVRAHLDGTIDVHLDAAVALPPPWRAVDDHWYRLPGEVELEDLLPTARTAGLPCPALVHLGTTGGADLFLDVEAVGVLGVDGPPADVAAILDAIGLGLAVSPFATGATLAMVGLPERLDDARADLDVGTDVSRALELARTRSASIAPATSSGASTFALRARSALERWEPAIVVLGVDAEVPDELVTLAATAGSGVALIAGAPARTAGGATLRRSGSCWMLEPAGAAVEPIGVEPADVGDVLQLIEEAEREHLADPAPFDQDEESAPATSFEERDWEFLVRVLGGVRVHDGAGVDVRFERSKAQELVCWLAVHRGQTTRTGARTALWEVDVRDATFANVVSDARRSLGRHQPAPDGQEWIGRTLSESLPLHPLVTTDAELLRARVEAARAMTPADAVEVLRPGLALVSDLPFAGTGYLWPDAEGTVTELVLLATGAAVDLARHCLELDDVDGVFWATGQGLRVLQGHEELVALRMRAHARRGDLAAVRAEWGSYERALAADPWSDAEPAAKLVELRHELLGPSAARA